VVTLDDITDLVSAQRSSAWADVARRIAHEIKNPLTPIQLSAERIRRRYGKRIEEDREVFDQCIDTIIRQVGDIGQMVDEFSSFARMRKPTKERERSCGIPSVRPPSCSRSPIRTYRNPTDLPRAWWRRSTSGLSARR
jgi:signal transduction histidine kinase